MRVIVGVKSCSDAWSLDSPIFCARFVRGIKLQIAILGQLGFFIGAPKRAKYQSILADWGRRPGVVESESEFTLVTEKKGRDLASITTRRKMSQTKRPGNDRLEVCLYKTDS